MLVGRLGKQQAALAQVGDDGRVGVLDEAPGPGHDLSLEPPLPVDRVDERQVVLETDAHVVLAEGGRDVDHARAVGGGDEVAADDVVRPLVGLHEAERRLVLQAEQVAAGEPALYHGAPAEHRLDQLGGQHEALAATLDQRVLDVGVHGAGDVGDERPGRGGPDRQRDRHAGLARHALGPTRRPAGSARTRSAR